eukprot:CAMPEP_0180093126 /NCGR_PEP_ID=MMETSP0985-20121206/24895_1 /TAXON_ID=483367 /ORGANISM="non described non described, Strain CCMP 2436" /LENGTH=137 /DNA_ID=CAMNT_0022028167 /DNA_START=297 /DNA_END=709 /DNA_ORIENTATION=-
MASRIWLKLTAAALSRTAAVSFNQMREAIDQMKSDGSVKERNGTVSLAYSLDSGVDEVHVDRAGERVRGRLLRGHAHQPDRLGYVIEVNRGAQVQPRMSLGQSDERLELARRGGNRLARRADAPHLDVLYDQLRARL